MFKKPFRVKSNSVMKGSDRKKLRVDIRRWFGNLTDENLVDIIPNKEEVTVVKVHTNGGDNVLFFCVAKNPILFQLDKDKTLYPTVYLLWKYPELVPRFTTWLPVFSKLTDGADLMLPGVVVRGELTPGTFAHVRKSEICSVSITGNRSPVVVGYTLMSGSDMYDSGMKGKGLRPVHFLGDELWMFGDKSSPPDLRDDAVSADSGDETPSEDVEAGSQPPEVVSVEALSIQEDSEIGTHKAEIVAQDTAQEEEELESQGAVGVEPDGAEVIVEDKPDPEAMDKLLHFCFLCALKASVKKSDLPLLTSAFYRAHMIPFAPEGQQLDIRKSTYKKLSKFLKQEEKSGIIRVKELSKGVDSVVEIDKTHLELRGFVPSEPRSLDTTETASSDNYKPPQISEVYSVSSSVLPLFKSLGHGKGSVFSSSDVRQVVTDYVKANQLQAEGAKNQVQLDPILAEVLLTRAEGDLSSLKWDEVFSRLLGKMQLVHQIVFPGQPPVIRKGKMESVKIDVAQRASNKKVTLIDNLEVFGIDPKEFAHTVQVKMACSASANPSQQKNKGLQVLIQGNQVTFVSDLLLNKYQVPRKYIQGLEKAPKTRRR